MYQLYRELPSVAPLLASLFRKLDQSPDNPRSHFELGEAAYEAGLIQLSMECFLRVTEIAPHVEAGFFNLGNAFFDLGQFDDARKAYEQAFKLKPDHGTLNNLGNSFAAMKEWEKAVQAFDRAISLSGCPPIQARTAMSNKGKTLVAAEDWDGALENYRQAIQRFPDDIEFLVLKAKCHRQRFEFGKGVECLVEALVASPNNPELLCQIADLNFARGRTMESLLCLNQAFQVLPPPVALQSRRLQLLNYCVPTTPERILNETTQWANSLSRTELNSTNEPSGKTLEIDISIPSTPFRRVGILCRDLATRGLRDWLPVCLAHCDPVRQQWILYCDQPVDLESQDLLVHAGCRLEDTSRLSNTDLASRIKTHELTVLVDMIGHGHFTRLEVFAKKPAPIQVSWCSFPMTSGLTHMDFIWSDEVSIPPESEGYFSEQVIRFPQSSFCFQPSCSIDLQMQHETTPSPFSVGFLSRPEQLSEPLIEAIELILERIPDAELVFIGQSYRDPAFQSEIRARFFNSAIVSGRIRFECFESASDELKSYQQLSVSLDPFFVSSPQRAFESLWMGVPVVTCPNPRLSGRGTASILNGLHRESWIANSRSHYVDAVMQLAECRTLRRSRRAELRSELLASPMCDIATLAQNIQAVLDESIHRIKLAKKTR